MKTNPCPTPDELTAFAVGMLPREALEDVAEHATGCERCSSTLDALADSTDPLIKELRRPVETDTADDAEVSRVVSLIERIGNPTGSPAAAATLAADEAPTASFRPDPELGRIGQYELLEKLGDGGMGQVYKARHALMDRIVAVKVIHKEHLAKPENVLRFQREIRALAQLDHPNIVRAEYADQAGDTHFLVMEYVEGINLHRLVKERGPLPIAEACDYIRQAAGGLAHAHERGLVHRDIKPSNILLQRELTAENAGKAEDEPGRIARVPASSSVLSAFSAVKLADFGLALLREGAPADELTIPGQVLGTLDYMAPEQWDDTHKVDHRADLYSLGCTLYYLLAGTPPFGGPEYQSSRRKMKAHLTEPPPSIRERRPDVPEELAAVLERMLAKEPAERYGTADEAAVALQRFITVADAPARPLAVEPAQAAVPSVADSSASAPRKPRRGRIVRFGLALGPLRIRIALALGILLVVGITLPWTDMPSPFLKLDRTTQREPGPLPELEQGKEPSSPLADPALAFKELNSVKLRNLAANWEKLDRPERELALQNLMDSENLPAAYRRVVEMYFQNLERAGPANPVRINSFQLSHYRGDPVVHLGEIGKGRSAPRFEDSVRIHVELAEPAHSFLIAFNPDGKEQLCHPKDKNTPPEKTAVLDYPSSPTSYFPLNDAVGFQAFVLLAFRNPPLAYSQWQSRVQPAPWKRVPAAEGVWQFDGQTIRLVAVPERGPERERRALGDCLALLAVCPDAGVAGIPWSALYLNRPSGPPEALVELCNFLKERSGADAIQVLAFPVKAK